MHILGESSEELQVETAAENRDTAISLAEQARFSLNIFTPDLDPRVFDNPGFERCVFNLARTHHSTDIRILVQDSSLAVKQGHCLVRLAQKMTSSVFIHNPAREHQRESATFMIVDGVGLLYRPQSTRQNYNAVVNFMAPQRAGELHDFFNEMWERSTPDSQVRRLFI